MLIYKFLFLHVAFFSFATNHQRMVCHCLYIFFGVLLYLFVDFFTMYIFVYHY